MICQQLTCSLITCPVTDDVASYNGAYTLQNGFIYSSGLIIVPQPDGGYYTQPPGSIIIPIPSNPSPTAPQVISYNTCSGMIQTQVPAGSTTAQTKTIMDAFAIQIAQAEAACQNHPVNISFRTYRNTPQVAFCGDPGPQMKLVGTLPPGVTFDISGLTVQGGMFESTVSQAAADGAALAYANNIITDGIVICGWWNQEVTCP